MTELATPGAEEATMQAPLLEIDLTEPNKPESSTTENDKAQKAFSKSILVSGIRCVLTYVALPFLLPFLSRLLPIEGSELTISSVIGLSLGIVAIAANFFSIRRFWRADHRWKVHVTFLHLCVVGLLTILMALDLQTLF